MKKYLIMSKLKRLVKSIFKREIVKDKLQFKSGGKVIGEIIYWVDKKRLKSMYGSNHPLFKLLSNN